ncbi:MAG: serine hydrolase [Solirubrobacteraceae bacterium]
MSSRFLRHVRALSVAGVVAIMAAAAVPALADSTAATGDESVSVPTAWHVYTGLTPAQITHALGNSNRLVELRRAANGTFTVAMVANSGAYAVSSWWWYYNASAAAVNNYLSTNHARLISVDRNPGGTFNVIMVANTGRAARSWWWYHGVTAAQISGYVSGNNARLVSLSADPGSSPQKYTAVMVSNTRADAKSWWWYYNATTAQVNSYLSSNHARLVDVDVEPNGHFDVIMVHEAGSDNKAWKWYHGTSASSLVNIALNTGYRVFMIEPYPSGGKTVYVGLMIDNLAAEPRRVENLLESGYSKNGLSGAKYGFEVKPIGSSPVLAFQNAAKYEPASAVKALYNLYAEFQVQLGNDSLSSPFTYWYKPSAPSNKDVCPLDYSNTASNKVNTTLEDGLTRMMQVSDNRTTQGTDLRYGRANVNSFASIIGMKGTFIHQTLGCGTKNGGYVTTTLNDMTKLYEGVWTNTLLNSTRSGTFFARMLGGTLSNSDPLATVINQEAASQGKSGIASQFISNTTWRAKGGSYDICPASGNCSPPYVYDRSEAGVLTLPFKSAGSISGHTYAYGFWVNDVLIPCTFPVQGQPNCAARNQADSTTRQIRAE